MYRILLLAFVLALPSFASLANVYIGQASAGGDTGVDCANRHANSFFNAPGNWGGGGSQIGPGTTVHLCGTITATAGTTALTFQGSGTVGNPITLLFETGAILEAPYFAPTAGGFGGGAITMSSFSTTRSYLIVDGGSNGIIRNTANGDALANQQDTLMISGYECSNCKIKNLHMTNIYVKTDPTSHTTDETKKTCIELSGSNWEISGNVMTQAGWCINHPYSNGDTNINIFNNEISFFTHGYALQGTSSGGGSASNIFFHDNYLHDTVNWDTAWTMPSPGSCDYHHDGIHAFGASGSTINGFYVYNNWFGGDWGKCQTGQVFVEAGSSDAGLSNSAWFNNVFVETGTTQSGNLGPSFTGMFGLFSGHSGTTQVYDNTCIHNNAVDGTTCYYIRFVTGLKFKNNAADQVNNPVAIDATTFSGSTDFNNNFYGNSCSGGNCFKWNEVYQGSFANWKTACSCDAAGVQNNTSLLNATTGAPSAGSPVINVAADLNSIATGNLAALALDTSAGNTRTAVSRGVGNWDMGAYEFGGSPPPDLNITVTTSPASLAITVDGVGATSPQSYMWTPLSSHTIATTSPQTSGGTRRVFTSWSDAGAISHSVAPSVDTTYTATFSTQFLLTTTPVGGGSVVAAPSSGDGFYNSGTVVSLTAVPNPGKQFSAWSGDVVSTSNPVNVTMSAAKNVTATFVDSTVTVRSVSSTATQAILKYKVTDNSVCTIEVSTSPTYTPVVYDTDSALFGGAVLFDSTRPFVIGAASRDRQMVIGQRTSAMALDGTSKFYSLALEANTVHYYRLTCSSGSGVATGSFVTGLAAPYGMGYEHPLFDSTAPWNIAVPTIDYSSTTKTYIDPKTGISMRPLTSPGQVGAFYQTKTWANTDFYFVRSGAWTNPQNILNGNAGTTASVSAAGTIFVGIDPDGSDFCGLSGYQTPCGVEDIGYQMFGGGGGGAAQVAICWSIDSGQSCYSTEYTVNLASGAPVDLGMKWGNTSSPSAGGAGWGKSLERRFLSRGGSGNAVAGAVTLTNSFYGDSIGSNGFSMASWFDADWAANSKIWVESSSPTCGHNVCNIASVTNATHLTTTEAITLSGKLLRGMQLGFKIRWISGTASITLSNYAIAKSVQWSLPNGGGTDQYQPIKITAGDGKQGYLGVNRDTGPFFSAVSFTTTDGEYRLLGALIPPCTIPGLPAADQPACGGGGGPLPDISMFHPTIPGLFYVKWFSVDTGAGLITSLFSVQYTCNYSAASGYGYYAGTGLNNFSYPSETGCFTWNNLTRVSQGRDVQSQINALPWYKSRWGSPTFFGVAGDKILFYKAASTQDSITGFFPFDLNGTLTGAFNSWDGSLSTNLTTRVTFTGVHNVESIGTPNGIALTVDALPGSASGQEYAGPYQSVPTCVYKSGVCAANTSLPPAYDGSYDGNCPANSFGATGNNCFRFRMQDLPCRTSPTPTEKSESPCPWDTNQASMFSQVAVPGDIFFDPDPTTPGPADTERFMIILKTSLGGGLAEFYALRDAALSYCVASNQSPGQKTHLNGWTTRMGIIRNGCDLGVMYVNLAGNSIIEGPRADLGGHFDVGFGNGTGTYSMSLSGAAVGDGIANSLPPVDLSNLIPRMAPFNFNGFGGSDPTLSNITQFYPSIRGAQPQPTSLNWRHINGGFGARDCVGCNVGPVSTTPVGGTTTVYDISIFGGPFPVSTYKSMPIFAWAGAYAMQDISSPTLGAVITDATPWKYCFVLVAGQCQIGSMPGHLYVSVPKADLTGVANVNSFGQRAPAATWLSPVMGWMTQTNMADKTASLTRRLSTAWGFPGWHEAFSNARILPDGSGFVWHIQQAGFQRQLFWGKLQNTPPVNSGNSTGISFIPVPIHVPANASYSQARIAFGYPEYGNSSQLFCTPYAESCYADGTTAPFNLPSLDGSVWASCTGGCDVTINAIPGRVLFFRIERGTGGVKQSQSAVQVVPAQ